MRSKGTMEPIRDRKQINDIKNWLLNEQGVKYSFLFLLGVNTGLRISDLLRLRVRDVKDKAVLTVVMEKTEKEVKIPLNFFIRQEITQYVEFKSENEYLFLNRSRSGAITRQRVSQVFKKVSAAFKIEKFNTHSMRKTFGYWYYLEKKDVYFLMKLFGHKTQAQTLDYIGIELDMLRDSIESFSLGQEVI
jgi:integrase